MAFRIFNNLSSLNAQRSLGRNTAQLGETITKIASGTRIQKSGDDPAGLAISESLRSDTRVLKQAARNANDGMALLNTSEGALGEIASILIRLREVAEQSASGTLGDTVRQTLQLEFNQLRSELDRIAGSVEFNGQNLLNGSLAANASDQVILQIGTDSSAENRFNLNQLLNINVVSADSLGIGNNISITTQGAALSALGKLESSVDLISHIRAQISSVQVRLGHTIASLNITAQNLTQADSNIRDTDISAALADLTLQQIRVQSSTAMLSQANLNTRVALDLLG